MTEIINLSDHIKKKNIVISDSGANEEQIALFSKNVLNTTKEWISQLNPETSDKNIIGIAFVILTNNSGCYSFCNGVDNRARITVLGSLDLLKSEIKNQISHYE